MSANVRLNVMKKYKCIGIQEYISTVVFTALYCYCSVYTLLLKRESERASLQLITLVWPMPSVHKHLLAVAREKGHIRGWQGRATTRPFEVTVAAIEMGYFAQTRRRRI